MGGAHRRQRLPIIGALFGGWGVFQLVFLHWLENGAIGPMTVVKLMTGHFTPPVSRAGKICRPP